MTIGESMAKCRKERGVLQYKLAEKAGLDVHSLCYYEKDKNEPSLYNLIRLADALHVSIDEYIGRIVPKEEVIPIAK